MAEKTLRLSSPNPVPSPTPNTNQSCQAFWTQAVSPSKAARYRIPAVSPPRGPMTSMMWPASGVDSPLQTCTTDMAPDTYDLVQQSNRAGPGVNARRGPASTADLTAVHSMLVAGAGGAVYVWVCGWGWTWMSRGRMRGDCAVGSALLGR